MLKITLCVLALGLAAVSQAAPPVIDNERVTVWDTMHALPPAQHDFVAVSFAKKGKPFFGHKGDVAGADGVRTAVIELKDPSVAPIANTGVYRAGGTLQSTTPDGKSVAVKLKAGDIRFNRRDRAHSELLVGGKPHAIIVELK